MDKQLILAIAFISILLLIGSFFLYMFVDWTKFKSKFFKIKKDELLFLKQYTLESGYSVVHKFTYKKIEKIIFIFKKNIRYFNDVNIESKFNKKYYPVFDLDEPGQLILFKKLYASSPYVLFQSSTTRGEFTDHYWGIVDAPYKKIENILHDHNWKICNDGNFVSFCDAHRKLMIRGLYESEDRKPKLYAINRNLSKNFQLFIDKVCIYYNKEGLELSVLRYKNPEMLIKFNRKRKLKKLNNL